MVFKSFIILTIFASMAIGELSHNSPMKILYRQKRSTCPAKFQHISGHTACISRSGKYISGDVTSSDKQDILKFHNDYRSGVNPTATNMLKMTWDDEIAMLAQKWAENCNFNHDDNYKRYIPGRFSVGQNLYTISGTPDPPKDWGKAIKSWYDEVVDFSYGSADSGSINGRPVGHYTQVVWAKSSRLGCGYAKCQNMDGFYVCNYGPSGNQFSSRSKPYKSGSSCADCGSKCSNKLCDCGSKVCYNGGTMDVNTCGCSCKSHAFIVGSSCALQCEGSTDPSHCGTLFKKADCPSYTNYPYDCPNMCETCPHGSTDVTDTTTTTSGVQPTTTTSSQQTDGQTTTTTSPSVSSTDSTTTTSGDQSKTSIQQRTTVPSATATTAGQQTTTTSSSVTTTGGSTGLFSTIITFGDQPKTSVHQTFTIPSDVKTRVEQRTTTTVSTFSIGDSIDVSDNTTTTSEDQPTSVQQRNTAPSTTATTDRQQTTPTSSSLTTTGLSTGLFSTIITSEDQPKTRVQQPTTAFSTVTSTVEQRTTTTPSTFSKGKSPEVPNRTIISSGDQLKSMVSSGTTTTAEQQTTRTSSSITTTVETEDGGYASRNSPHGLFVMLVLCLLSAKAVKLLL